MISKRWPQAVFEISEGDDPAGIYLDATVDIEDPDEVMDLVVDRLLELQVDESLPVHVVPLRPIERALEATLRGAQHRSYGELLSSVESRVTPR